MALSVEQRKQLLEDQSLEREIRRAENRTRKFYRHLTENKNQVTLEDGSIINPGDIVLCVEVPTEIKFLSWHHDSQKKQVGKSGNYQSVGKFGDIDIVNIEGPEIQHIWPLCAIRRIGSGIPNPYPLAMNAPIGESKFLADSKKSGAVPRQCDVEIGANGEAISARSWNPADKHEVKIGDQVILHSWVSCDGSVIPNMTPDHVSVEGKIGTVKEYSGQIIRIEVFNGDTLLILFWPLVAVRRWHMSKSAALNHIGQALAKQGATVVDHELSAPTQEPEVQEITEAIDSNGRKIVKGDRVRFLRRDISIENSDLVGSLGIIESFYFMDGNRMALTSIGNNCVVEWETRHFVSEPIDPNPDKKTDGDRQREHVIKKIRAEMRMTRENRHSDKHIYAERLASLRKHLKEIQRADPNIEF